MKVNLQRKLYKLQKFEKYLKIKMKEGYFCIFYKKCLIVYWFYVKSWNLNII